MTKDEAIAELRRTIKPGTTLRTILRHGNASGTARSISVLYIDSKGKVRQLDYLAATALGYKRDERHDGIKISGGGMDMGFDLVYSLSSILYGPGDKRITSRRGYLCLGPNCPSSSHSNAPIAPRHKGEMRHHDGYALRQRWL